MHPEISVKTTDPTVFGRNYFNRASAPDMKDKNENLNEKENIISASRKAYTAFYEEFKRTCALDVKAKNTKYDEKDKVASACCKAYNTFYEHHKASHTNRKNQKKVQINAPQA